MKLIMYTLLFCVLACASVNAGNRHCTSCYTPVYHAQAVVNHVQTVVIENQIVAPVRVTRYREIKGLRLVEDQYGNSQILIGDKLLSLNEGKTVSTVEALRGSVLIERVITKSDVYGNQTVTIEKEINK